MPFKKKKEFFLNSFVHYFIDKPTLTYIKKVLFFQIDLNLFSIFFIFNIFNTT